MKYSELSLGQVEAIVNKLGGMDGVRLFLANNLKVVEVSVITTTHHLIVDYTKSFDEMVRAGKYFSMSYAFEKSHFPMTTGDAVEVDVTLIHFNHEIRSSNVAVEELNKIGYRPATIEELLSFGATYPDIQKQFTIVALGSSYRGMVPYLSGYNSEYGSRERSVGMGTREGILNGNFRFLAVRK